MGLLAVAAARRTIGWPRALFTGIGVTGLVTGATRYCPFNHALGVTTCIDRAGLEEQFHQAEVDRQLEVTAVLGEPPPDGPPVSLEEDAPSSAHQIPEQG